jgi:hypothetical protein
MLCNQHRLCYNKQMLLICNFKQHLLFTKRGWCGEGRRFPKFFTEVSVSKLTNNFFMVQCISDTLLKEKNIV